MRIRLRPHRSLTFKRGRNPASGDTPARPLGLAGRILRTLFFGFFLTAGLFFAVIISREFTDDAATKSWPSSAGKLIRADITVNASSKNPFTLTAEYRYTVNDRTYTGNTVRRGLPDYSDYRKAQLQLNALQQQTPLRVYYQPDNPNQSVLQHAAGWPWIMLLLPTVFILVGGAGVARTLFFAGGRKEDSPTSFTTQAAGPDNKVGIVFLIFAAFGIGFLSFFMQATFYVLTSGGWPEVPCSILYSQLRSYQSDDGTTYKVDILFEYEFQGKTYRSNKAEFLGISSSGTRDKRKILSAYPKGSEQTCFVNPADPTLAVLNRKASPVYFFMLLPLLFVVIGVGGFTRWLWNRHVPEPAFTAPSLQKKPAKRSILTAAGEVELKSKQHRITQFIILLVFAVFWNGITFGLLVREVVETWQDGRPDWFTALFSIPFVAVGIGILAAAFVHLLKLFNPVLHLYVSQPDMAPGESITIRWQMRGGLKPVEELTLRVTGEEVARYRRGTDTMTDRHTFYEDLLVEGGRFQNVDRGTAKLTLPANTMHSFDQPDNKIVWSLKAHGVIHFWPDVTIEYEFPVTPGRTA